MLLNFLPELPRQYRDNIIKETWSVIGLFCISCLSWSVEHNFWHFFDCSTNFSIKTIIICSIVSNKSDSHAFWRNPNSWHNFNLDTIKIICTKRTSKSLEQFQRRHFFKNFMENRQTDAKWWQLFTWLQTRTPILPKIKFD
jgi:hypothetical protein